MPDQTVASPNKTSFADQLFWSEAARALVCMIPMLVAVGLGMNNYLVTLGQGGFFFSTLFLAEKIGARFVTGALVLAFGLGLYLVGGVVSPTPVTAVIFTFLVCLCLSFLTSWKVGGPLALTFVMIYTAGLNTGSPEKASLNFYVFAFVMGWSALISMLPIWKSTPVPPPSDDDTLVLTEQGFRMGVGAALALALSYMFDFAKLGWAPSAVGNIVRYDHDTSTKRAWMRFYGTIGGALLASVGLAFCSSTVVVVLLGSAFAILNGLFKRTILGMMPFFYTATILLLYSANDLGAGPTVVLQRVFYNLIGISIGMLFALYPFPAAVKALNKSLAK